MIPKRHWSLLLTRFSNKGILTWLTKREKKPNVVKESITPPISAKNKIYTVNKIKKSQESNKTVASIDQTKDTNTISLHIE